MFYLTALTSLATVLFYTWLGYRVARARMTYGVPAPATTGDPTFERHYRIQMNTLEWLPIQIVGLWMFAIYVSDLGAAVLGVIWIIGRAIYARAYLAEPKSRTAGFVIQLSASLLLCLGAVGDIFMRLVLGD
ncbi:glutathione S-transferase [Rhodoblastus acidophilus]|uniref:MAPEG family protein n=1 Tax=Rhodoblastus acidophilus TaxID=1074 RepID=UPI0022242FFA|nr:MAPEG family protein [Rhodoblastus acidophilus]MCW2283702.1 glutathione S-transferase [Rhodoblastus acidophilus]MCW2332949.1 glutathione S-transferase [Rhodoblastus acidophilus]